MSKYCIIAARVADTSVLYALCKKFHNTSTQGQSCMLTNNFTLTVHAKVNKTYK